MGAKTRSSIARSTVTASAVAYWRRSSGRAWLQITVVHPASRSTCVHAVTLPG
jgi:hypothetical protein